MRRGVGGDRLAGGGYWFGCLRGFLVSFAVSFVFLGVGLGIAGVVFRCILVVE